jgi:hypothetical protein
MDRLIANTTVWAGLSALLLLCVSTAQAQQPSQAQRDAVRQSCRSDFMANCSGVTPGGKDALDCLKRNMSSLSGACQAAVSALSPPAPAAAPSPPPPAATQTPNAASPPPQPAANPPAAHAKPAVPMAPAASKPPPPSVSAAVPASPNVLVLPPREALRIVRICEYDQRTLCPGVPLGGGRVIACLMQNMPALSPRCRDALTLAAH